MKLKPEDLDKISKKMRPQMNLREGTGRVRITVHMGTCGIASGAREILKAFLEAKETVKTDDIILTTSGCAGLCSKEPMATIELKGMPPVKYIELTPEKVEQIFTRHVMGGELITDFALAIGSERVS